MNKQKSVVRQSVMMGCVLILTIIMVLASVEGGYRLWWTLFRKVPYSTLTEKIAFSNRMMAPHPYLVGSPRRGVKGVSPDGLIFEHNTSGFRGPEITTPKPKGKFRIVAVGGSTTYGTGETQSEIWTIQLQSLLGTEFEVINAGAPGYSSAEHVIQTALVLPELKPDLVLFFLGWNDLRNTHIRNLASDYSNYHGLSQFSNLRVLGKASENNSMALFFLKGALFRSLIRSELTQPKPEPAETAWSSKASPESLRIYEQNLTTLKLLTGQMGATVVFVPQVLNEKLIERVGQNVQENEWTPFIKNSDLMQILTEYNLTLKNTALRLGSDFFEQMDSGLFSEEDFVESDFGHFNKRGHRKFSELVQKFVLSLKSVQEFLKHNKL